MDSRNYIFIKIEEKFNTTYNIQVSKDSQQTHDNVVVENFNEMDYESIDNAVTDYNFTFRQNRQGIS
jgi:hypothetical protein